MIFGRHGRPASRAQRKRAKMAARLSDPLSPSLWIDDFLYPYHIQQLHRSSFTGHPLSKLLYDLIATREESYTSCICMRERIVRLPKRIKKLSGWRRRKILK